MAGCPITLAHLNANPEARTANPAGGGTRTPGPFFKPTDSLNHRSTNPSVHQFTHPIGGEGGNTKPGCKGAARSFGSPAISGGVGETLGFPPTPHSVFGLSRTLSARRCFLLSPSDTARHIPGGATRPIRSPSKPSAGSKYLVQDRFISRCENTNASPGKNQGRRRPFRPRPGIHLPLTDSYGRSTIL